MATIDDVECIAIAGVTFGFMAIAGAAYQMKSKKVSRSVWVKPWVMQRPMYGAYTTLFNDLLNTDESAFRNFIRMDLAAFEEVLSRVEFDLTKTRTRLLVLAKR